MQAPQESNMARFAKAHAAVRSSEGGTHYGAPGVSLEEALHAGGQPNFEAQPFVPGSERPPLGGFAKGAAIWSTVAALAILLLLALLSPSFVRSRKPDDAGVVQRGVSIVRLIVWTVIVFALVFLACMGLWATKKV